MIPEKYMPHIRKLARQDTDLLSDLESNLSNGKAFITEIEDSLSVGRFIFDVEQRMGLHVWVGISLNRYSFMAHFNAANLLCKMCGVQFLQFETKRKGFERTAPKLGFKQHGVRDGYTIWKKEV